MTDAERPDGAREADAPEPASGSPEAGEPQHALEPDDAATVAPPEPEASDPAAEAAPPRRHWWIETLADTPESSIEMPRRRLAAQSRRDFLLFTGGTLAAAAGAWWLLPDLAKARLVPGRTRHRLDTAAARVGLTRANRERLLDRALTFDDDVAEALFSKERSVRTFRRSQVTRLPVNYAGRVPGPEYLTTWALEISGLASGGVERLTVPDLLGHFAFQEQVTRLVCVEGWSAIAWWGGIRFADVLGAFPPAPGARWAGLRSSVSLDGAGRPQPYYVSLDLETASHPQVLLATHQGGRPLTLPHGAPLRLLAPMKLGLKNIKAITHIAYTANEPPDFWHQRGYSKFDGL